MEKHADRKITKQTVKLKFADFQQTTVDIQSSGCFEDVFIELLDKALMRANNRKIRLVGLVLGFDAKQGDQKNTEKSFQHSAQQTQQQPLHQVQHQPSQLALF